MSPPRIKLPERCKVGDVIDIKTVATHPMESGNRRNAQGQLIARNIIKTFVARFEGREVFRVDLGSGISANPYFSFSMRVPGPGTFTFTWTADDGQVIEATGTLTVEG